MNHRYKLLLPLIVPLLAMNLPADAKAPGPDVTMAQGAMYPNGVPPDNAPPAYTDHTASPAHDFLDSVAINTHIDAKTTSYNDADLVAASLKYVGIHYVREDALEGGSPFQVDRYLKLVAVAGAKFDFSLGKGDAVDLAPAMLKDAGALEQASPGAVNLLEGYNEIDEPKNGKHHLSYNGNTVDIDVGDYRAAVDGQKYFYELAHKDPVLKAVPVLPYCFGWFNRSEKSPDVSAYADYANIHAYAIDGGSPSAPLARQVEGTMHVKGKPIIMTETGYPTLYPGAKLLKNLVDEQVQERFLLDTLFDNFSDKVVRTYLYELQDRRANYNDSTDQAHYGVFRYDGTPKAAATALRNLMAILGPDSSQGLQTTPLSYQLTSTVDPKESDFQDLDPIAQQYRRQDDVMKENFTVLLQKKPGVYDLVIWSEPQIWDAKLFVMLPRPEIDEATLRLPSAPKSIKVYDPTMGADPIQRYSNTSQIKALIVDHPVIVEISQ